MSKDEIDQHIEDFKQNKELSEQNSRNFSQASTSKITTPEEDEKKLEKLRLLIQQEVDANMKVLMQQIPSIVNQTIQQLAAQQQQSAPQPQEQLTQAGNEQQMPPGAALAALDPNILTGIAQLIQAWKGGNTQQAPDQFGEMFKQLGINIMQAGVDGIYKNVYDGYQPQPRNTQLQAGNIQSQNPNPNQQRSTGFQ